MSNFREQAFEQPAELAAMARRFPPLWAKTLLLMDAYVPLDLGMADAFAKPGLAELRATRL